MGKLDDAGEVDPSLAALVEESNRLVEEGAAVESLRAAFAQHEAGARAVLEAGFWLELLFALGANAVKSGHLEALRFLIREKACGRTCLLWPSTMTSPRTTACCP